MKTEFEFNHNEEEFTKAIPSKVDPLTIARALTEADRSDQGKKSKLIEQIIKKANVESVNDILVIGMAFGSAQSMERLMRQLDEGLPPPPVVKGIIEKLLYQAYKGYEGASVSINSEGVKEHCEEKENDF